MSQVLQQFTIGDRAIAHQIDELSASALLVGISECHDLGWLLPSFQRSPYRVKHGHSERWRRPEYGIAVAGVEK